MRPRHGLSPRVRGNHEVIASPVLGPGSIPACAGEPSEAFSVPASFQVYPRVCGGTIIALRNLPTTGGLSPRVRGNRSADGRREAVARSIPACAGEPSYEGVLCRNQKVYPRVCGGTETYSLFGINNIGLSPRVRGNRVRYLRRK